MARGWPIAAKKVGDLSSRAENTTELSAVQQCYYLPVLDQLQLQHNRKAAESSRTMRYYFHLVSSMGNIPDSEGVEVASLSHAKTQALMAIEELRSEEDATDDEWVGWRLEVTDASGHLMMVFDLGNGLS